MTEQSKIAWTDHTFNPWAGCTKVSEGCLNCYAQQEAEHRYRFAEWGPGSRRRITAESGWKKPVAWNRKFPGARIFSGSWCDVFEDHPDVPEARQRLWDVIAETPNLRWQLLTKRPENILRMVPWGDRWPGNIWVGVTVENQRAADIRIPILQDIPAALRFLSCEPLLERITLDLRGIHWVIAGGESGAGRRPMNLEWVRNIRDQVKTTGLPFFFKQKGSLRQEHELPELDGRTWGEFPGPHAPV